MPCEWYKTENGGVIHVNRGRSGGKQVCQFCRQHYRDGKLCDFPIGDGKTCDAAMCAGCSRTLGTQNIQVTHGLQRLGDTIDVCPNHREHATVQQGRIVVKE